MNDTKIWGLNISNTLSRKTHVDNLYLNCCAMRSVKPFVSKHMLKLIYYIHFHSIMSYVIIFWGHSSSSIRVFRLQKRIIRIMMGSRSTDSCRNLFISLKILPFPSLYIFFLLRFVIKNRALFTTNNEIRKFGSQHHNFHHPSANLRKYQDGVFFMSIKVYNSLPTYIKKESINTKKF